MGVHYLIKLLDGQGKTIEELQDTHGVVDDELVYSSDSNRSLLQYIDQYGTTTFNGLQCNDLHSEIINTKLEKPESREFVLELLKILRVAADGVHLYVVFNGD